ncbi:histidine kinase [Streptomyces sp. NBC_01275]|uniref:sensor histidine kinase n=1 Tax=Streptomyces sp. NBC_01275 TaxID=2903807 RepID=UPI00224F28C7|nr:histidine kinase [Streptomyces sp. NBC_01275]MCX4763608.1 histidine kinase [Streptomyces sp. NBC_01275]
MRSGLLRGCARGAVVGALVTMSVVDLMVASDGGHGVWRPMAVLAVGLAAVLWPAARRPAWLTPQLRTAVPGLLSVLYTATAVLFDRHAPFGPGELAVLLCLLFIAVRHCPPRWAVVCAALDAGALLVTPARYFRPLWSGEWLAYALIGLVLVGLVAGLAAYLRSLDYRRTVAVAETRRAERLAIAADLHDFVAHHVTGILVQTQMARMMETSRRDRPPSQVSQDGPGLDPVLAGIERAATQALASMRRTVGVLRAPDGDPNAEGARRPVGDLAAVAELADDFASTAQRVVLDRDPAVSDDLPHEVQAAAFRVVQEALTNVRRHAADADTVTVGLRQDGVRLEVTVCDDGRGGTQLPAEAHGGGFGLVGLTERVTALGGELHAGPTRTGHGWEVRARFPTR